MIARRHGMPPRTTPERITPLGPLARTRPVARITSRSLLACLAVLAACGDRASGLEETSEPIEAPAPFRNTVDERSEEKPGFLAVLTPKQSADVYAPYTSAAATLLVRLGDTVTQGQVLARLDDRQLRQELAAARAQARTARAAITQAEVEHRGRLVELRREKKANTEGVGSPTDLDAAVQAVARAVAAISVARATADERNTRIAQLEAHLKEMTLVAPIAGSVALIYPQDGARVEEGRPVIRLISGGVFVKFAMPADRVGTVKPGDLVDVRVERRTDLVTAKIGHIAPEVDAVAQMIIGDAEVVNAPADLQPGTVCRIVPRTTAAATR